MRRARLSRGAWICAAVALSPGLAAAQKLGGAAEADVSWLRVAAALLLCLGLAVAAAVVLRVRLRGPLIFKTHPAKQLRLIETLRLSHQVDICLVGYDDKQVLLASTSQGALLISVNARASAPEEAS